MKKRTKIENIPTAGFELAETQLRLVSGGAQSRKCWVKSGSVTRPGEVDNAEDYQND